MAGETQSSGRLEIYDSARGWGTICSEGFTMHAANTACTQLGYSAAITFDRATSLRWLNVALILYIVTIKLWGNFEVKILLLPQNLEN